MPPTVRTVGALISDAQPAVAQTWRPMRREDAAALAELLAAAEHVDQMDEHHDEDDVVKHHVNDLVDLGADTRLVWRGDELVGFAAVFGQRRVREVHSVWLSGTVHPLHRRQGLGRQLLRWQLERAEQLHAERHPAVPANLMCNVSEDQWRVRPLGPFRGPDRSAVLVRHGPLARAPDPPLPPVQPVLRVRIEPYDSGRDEEVRLAHNIAFNGHFGSTERDPEEWRGYFTGSRAFRPELSLLAVADDSDAEVAGYLLAYVFEADVAASGRREVYVGQIGTLPDYRGSGVGSALMATALAQWSAAGHHESYLGVDTANGTGALGLYERAGYRVHKRSASWGRTVRART